MHFNCASLCNQNRFRLFLADQWKVHRRLVSPTLNQTSVGAHIPIFNENIRKIVSSLPTNGEFFDILPSIATCMMTMFVEAALGTKWEPEVKQRYLRQFMAYVLPQSILTLQMF